MVQLFWGPFFGYVFIPFQTSNFDQFLFQKKAKAASSKQPAASPASQQYICQYKIQPIVPNTFSNKESIAQEDSLHNLLEKVYFLYSIVCLGGGGRGGGGLLITFPHYVISGVPTRRLRKKRLRVPLLRSWQNAGMVDVKVTTFMALDMVVRRRKERIAI